jgi:glycosyltransferase involved in cell wall biosynthesis
MAVVAVSERDAELFRSIVPEEKLHTIPNGIDSVFGEASRTRYPIGNGPHTRRLICVGRVSKAKAIDRVIDLFAQVAPDFPELELVIAGPDDNGEADVLRRRSAVLGLESRVRIVGGLPLDALAGLVANADLFISAAPHEGFGITTVEALCAGVPVMVTRTGVHEQIVQPGVNGWFWSGIPDGLLLPDARLHKMQIAARASAAPFNWDTTTDKYERVLESAHRQGIG